MEDVFEDSSLYLERYRDFLTRECHVAERSALHLTPAVYAKKQSLYLLLFREIARCHIGTVDDSCEVVKAASISTYGMFRAVVAMDGVIDDPDCKRSPERVLESMLHHEAAVRALCCVPQARGSSTRTLRRLSRMYLSTHHHERKGDALTRQMAMRMLFRKSCMVLMPLAWAQDVYGSSKASGKVRSALIKLFVALQLIDDVRDYAEDANAGRSSLFLECAYSSGLVGRNASLLEGAPHTQADAELLEALEDHHLRLALSKLVHSMSLFIESGSAALAACVDLVRIEIERVLLVSEERET